MYSFVNAFKVSAAIILVESVDLICGTLVNDNCDNLEVIGSGFSKT